MHGIATIQAINTAAAAAKGFCDGWEPGPVIGLDATAHVPAKKGPEKVPAKKGPEKVPAKKGPKKAPAKK